MMEGRIIKIIVLFLIAISVEAQIGSFVEAPSGRTRIGDHFTVKYSIDRDPELEIIEIDYSVFADSVWIKIIDTTGITETKKSGSIQLDFEITFSLYKEGEVTIPGIPVYYAFNSVKDTFYTKGVNVKVEFLPSPDKIAPLKDIIEEESKWYDNILYYIIAFAILLGVLWFITRKKKKVEWEVEKIEPELPERHAHEVALEQLLLLEEKKLIEAGKFKDFQIELTGIMRTYIKKRFNINATELTSKETISELSQKVTTRQLVAVKEVLDIADLVKFAKFQPAETIHDSLLEKARNFFTKTAKNLPHL